jgi:hypothetical protein
MYSWRLTVARYGFWDADQDDDAAFDRRLGAVLREVGDRGKLVLSEASSGSSSSSGTCTNCNTITSSGTISDTSAIVFAESSSDGGHSTTAAASHERHCVGQLCGYGELHARGARASESGTC